MNGPWSGIFRDGRSAADIAVTVRCIDGSLTAWNESGEVAACWPLARTSPVAHAYGRELRLCCADHPHQRLILHDAETLRPHFAAPKTGKAAWIALCLGAVVIGAGLIWALPKWSKWAADMVPTDVEKRWGDAVADNLRKSGAICSDPAGNKVLYGLFDRLNRTLPVPPRAQKVMVLDHPAVNAAALPGGIIVVFGGLLKTIDDPDQAAGILAHEIAHVHMRHPLAAAIRSAGAGILLTLFTGDAVGAGALVAGSIVNGAYSRPDESAADAMAVDILHRSGLSAGGLAQFFDDMSATESKLPITWLSSHPASAERRDAIAGKIPPAEARPALTPQQWRELRNVCSVKNRR